MQGFARVVLLGVLVALVAWSPVATAHGVEEGDAAFIEGNEGANIGVFLYLGAKHMVTGYDHLLFLVGVIFFLYRMKDVLLYVSMFTFGHSITLIAGVLGGIHANAYLIDAIIGLSVVYKGFDNLGGFQRLLGFQPNPKAAVFLFGLFHGFGLATKLQEFHLSPDGLVANILSFNIGVEVGQFLALGLILLFMAYWRTTRGFNRYAFLTNTALMCGGFLLVGYQLTGYFVGG
ncbi:MAG TPA: HupE/UreJ family protein [Candidatus Thermoplasmatota archaeon]|nr:HupE/UreJ family protein [Candidatus Thermoplasmatota archaeon]